MINSREFNFKEKFPGISEDKMIIIQKYYDTNIINMDSDSTYVTYLKALCAMCSALQNFDYIPFSEWDTTVMKSFLHSMDSSSTYLFKVIAALKCILAEAGCKNDLSSVSISNVISEYCSPLLSFEVLNTMIKRIFYEERPLYTWDQTNSWTIGIVIYYLFWLGFTREDICHLKISDFDNRTCTFIYQGKNYTKKRNVAERIDEATGDYISRYFNSKTYETYSEELGWRNIPYADGDAFIKLTSSKKEKMQDILSNHINKMRDYTGLRSAEILTAGRMDRLYYLNKIKNVPITTKNAAMIAEDLGLKLPVKVQCGTEVGDLILMYNSYKTKREALYQNV